MDYNDNRMDRMDDDEGFEYNYDYHYVGPDENEYGYEEEMGEEDFYRPRQRKRPKKLLVVVQLAICATILMTIMMLKVVGGPAYLAVKQWYVSHAGDSIIAQESINRFTEAWVNFFSTSPAEQGNASTPDPASSGIPASSAPDLSSAVSSVAYTTSIDSEIPVFVSVFLDYPVKGGIVTSGFGPREEGKHLGIDLGAPSGTPIVPAMPGKVEFSGENSSYGKYLLVDHGSNIKTRYAHCEKLLVKEGEAVVYGQPIALVGSTGESTGPHLHFELILSDICYDPQPLFKNRSI